MMGTGGGMNERESGRKGDKRAMVWLIEGEMGRIGEQERRGSEK